MMQLLTGFALAWVVFFYSRFFNCILLIHVFADGPWKDERCSKNSGE